MEWFWVYASALGLGFLGGAHCIGMCGGIMAALSFAVPNQSKAQRWKILLAYNAGRISSYVLIALLAGALVQLSAGGHGLSLLRIVAGALLIAMGLYLAGWWRGLTYLEKGGSYLWRYIQPLGKKLMPVKTVPQALLLGAVWGWLPCGLIYSALAFSAAQSASGGAVQSAAIMLAFGLGTLPAVLASGVLAERIKNWMQNRNIRTLFALSIIAFGCWTVYATLQHASHADHANHQQHTQQPAGSETDTEHQHHHHH